MSFTSFLQLPIALAAFAAIIVPVVAAHELGHLLAAFATRIPVATFSVGFGPEVWGRTSRSGIRWRLSAIPFGGYVAFGGRSDPEPQAESLSGRLFAPPREDGFSRAAPWRRLVVLLAGPAASVAFAAAVFFAAWLVCGVPDPGAGIASVEPGSPAAAAGLVAGDRIDSAAGETGERTIRERIASSPGKVLDLVVSRGATVLSFPVTVGSKVVATPLGSKTFGRIGIALSPSPRHFDPAGAARLTWDYMGFLASSTGAFVHDLFGGHVAVADLSSPIGIATVSGRLVQNDLEMYVRFAGAVSFAVGVTNMFPIPGLDGGLALIAALEIAVRRRFSRRAVATATLGGLALALGVMVTVMAGEIGAMVGYAFSR